MSECCEKDSPKTLPRLYPDKDGKVFMLDEALNLRVEVIPKCNEESVEGTPEFDEESLEVAKQRLIRKCQAARELETERLVGKDAATATLQQKANRSIKEIVSPKAASKVTLGFEIFYGVLLVLASIYFLYKGVKWSQDYLPEYLHWVVLAFYLTLLTLCVYLMATEERRRKERDKIKALFGPRGMLVLPTLTLLTAAPVFASITLSLHRRGLVVFQECTNRPVEASSLTDFYLWHFLKLVPLVKINEVMKLGEPLCYSQKRVGLLILIFQALVVLPSVNTVLYYWKHRRELSAPPYRFDAGWEPTKKAEGL